MNERDRTPHSKSEKFAAEEAEVRDLITGAGPRPIVPVADFDKIKTAARREWRAVVEDEQRRAERFPHAGLLAMAASVALAFIAAWWWTSNRAPIATGAIASVEVLRGDVRVDGSLVAATVGSPLQAGNIVETGADAQPASGISFQLLDGKSVRLNRDTSVRLVSASRIELQRGSIYVDSGVGLADSGSIAIETAFGTVRDIGTQFEVRVNGGDEAMRIRVREGEVSLDSSGDSHVAGQGEVLSVRRDGSLVRGTVEPYGPMWDWTLEMAPGFDIEGQHLPAYLDWVSRETGLQIRFLDAAVEQSASEVVLHGTIEDLTPQESLTLVLPGSDLDYRIDGGVLVIERASAAPASAR